MEKQLITLRTFNDLALAEDLANSLKQNGIYYELKTFASKIDPATLTSAAPEYFIMAYDKDFNKINQILEENVARDVETVEDDYYLFGFTDKELIDLITKADEWSAFDVMLARKILKDRGNDLSAQKIDEINNQRIEALRRPEPSQTGWIVAGYITALLGGIIGIFIGWHLYTYKKTLPNGERVFDYTENDRKHGRIIFYLATVVFFVAVSLKIAGQL